MISSTFYVALFSSFVSVERGGLIDASGAGYSAVRGPGKGSGTVGGSYASSGGRSSKGTQYGSLFRPLFPGSGGACGAGGGHLYIEAGDHVIVDGAIMSDGRGSGSSSSGGGSGGSVMIKTLYFKGYGTVSCNGGEFTNFQN